MSFPPRALDHVTQATFVILEMAAIGLACLLTSQLLAFLLQIVPARTLSISAN